MKVPGGDSIFDRMAEGAQGGPAAATSFTPPVADVSGDAAGVEERLKSSFTHMAGQNERFLDVPELDRQVRDVRALEELGKLSTEERKRTAAANPRAKADQDAFDIVDKVNAGNADFYIDQAAGSPSIMDGYTPPPNTRPMDADKAQALAASTLQRFGLLDQAGVDAAKARQEAEAQATLGLPPELIGDNPSQAMRQAKEMGGAVEAYARMYPVTAGFLHDFPNLVRDDWENLNWLEKLGRQFNNGTMRGQAQVKLSQVMEDVRLNGITPERIAQARLFEQDMKNAAGMPMDTWGQKIVGNAAEQLPQFAYGMPEAAKNSAAFMGMAITGALATGGATTPMVLPMAAVGAKVGYAEFTRQMEGGLAFWELLNMKDAAGNHLDMTGIRVGSEIVGGINAALELAELQMLTKTMPWARRALSEVGREAALKTLLNPTFRQAMFRGFGEFAKFEAKEIGQEVLQELTQVASEEVNKAYARRFGANFAPTTSAELQDRLLDIAEKTAYGMVAFGGPGIAIRTVREASQTAQGKQFLDTFMERIRGDKLAKEAPSAFEALMSANVQAGVLPEKVYMAPDKVLALFQDKDSGQLDVDGLRDFLERAGVDRQVFLDRIGNQADVSFDTARLGRILSTDAGQMLHSQGELTFSPRERAVAQAQAEVERAQATGDPVAIATAESALRETETSISDADRETLDTLFQTAVSRGREFRERIVADMVAAGSTKTEAKANAALIDASAHVWSSETGQPVEEYYRLFGYRFRKTNFGNVLANIYKRDYAGVFKSERDFFQRFDRNEGFRQDVLARVNLGEAGNVQGEMSAKMPPAATTAATESAKTAPKNVRPDVTPGGTMKAPAATPAATVPTASSSPQPAAGAPAAGALVAPGPTFEVVRAPARTPGGEGTILTPGGDAVPFRYAVMERADVHASHLPTQGFAKNPEYAHTNERDYRTNRAFQERVMERAMPGKFQPEFLVGHSVDAINGAPIVDDTGSVLGGNSRKMILDLAFEKQPESAARYADALRAALPALGLDPAAVDGMREPVLVRSLSRVYDAPNTAKLVSAFNQDFKAAMDSRREGISNAKFITPDTAKTLAAGLDGFDTIRSYLDDKASLSFVEKMFRDGALPDSLRSRIVSEDGTLNTEGKDLVVNALRGAVVDDYELVGRVKDGTMKKVDRVIPHMLRIMSREDQFNIQPSFKAAVALLTSWQNGKETETFKAYMNQAGLFTDQADPRRDPVIARLAMALAYNKELELARQFSAYADAAALNQPGRMALPGTVPTFEEALARIGVAKNSGKAGGQKMFFQDKRPEYQNTEQGGELAGVVYTADGFFAVQRKSWAWGTPYALPIEQELTSFPDSRGMRPEQLLTSSQNALRVQAMAQQGDFVRHLQDLAGMTGGTEVLARVKSSESLTRKVEGELQGDLRQARDVLAGTITYPSLEAAAKAAKFLLDSRPASEVVYFSNRYSNPTPGGFRDFYFILRMPNGFMAELQVNTRDMVAAKEGLGHTLYEVSRLMDTAGVPDGSLARTALDQVSQAFYAAAVSPDAAQGLSRALEDLDNNMPELRRAAEAIVPQPILDNVVGYIASAVVNGRDALLNYRVFDQAQPVNTTGQRGPLLQRAPGRPVDILFRDAGAKSLDLGKLTLVERTENGATFRTGQPVTFDFVHNTKSATALYGKPDKDAPFGRGLEPSGRYVNATRDASKAPDNLESGTLTLKNPLVLDNAGLAWKQELSDAYGGLTGKSLSLALLADGYDGVVTVDSPGGRLEHVSEILDLTTFDEAKALYQDRRRGDLAAVHNLSEGPLLQRSPGRPIDMLFQSVWHGSPHRFDKFSTEKIGTGEGAQAYGWGLYFAGRREVAEWYREKLSAENRGQLTDAEIASLPPGLTSDETVELFDLGREMQRKGNLPAQEMARWKELKEKHRIFEDALDELTRKVNTGQLYKVDIPEDSDLLDWDKPLSEQPEQVKKALESDPEVVGANGIPKYSAKRAAGGGYYAVVDVVDAEYNTLRPQKIYREKVFKTYEDASTGAKELFADRSLTGQNVYVSLSKKLGSDQLASEYLKSIGIPGLRYLDGNSRGPGEEHHNYVIFDDAAISKPETFYQDRRRGDLAAVHNLSEGNLVYADKLGGLAMPSVGVTKAETPFQGFGEISLVGTPDLVDPKNTPVFDADAYTKRFPEIMHPKVPMKVGQAFFKQHMDTFKETDELNKLQSEIWDDMVNKPNAKRALEVFSFSKAAMLMFLRERGKNVAIPRERVVTALNFMDAQGLAELRENLAQDTEPDRAGVGGIIAAAARRYAEQVYGEDTEKVAKLEQSVLSGFGLQDGVVGLQGYDKVRHALREEGKTVVAGEALRRELQAQVNQEDFAAWAEQRVMSVYGPPFIKLRGKNAPVTLDNLVEAMRGQKVNAQEKGITFSPGAARAAAAQKLTNAGQYDKLRDDITSPEKRKASVAAAEDTLEAYRMAAVKAFTLKNWRGETDYWSGFDASMKALAASGGDPKRLQAMLQRNDFQAVGQDVLDKGVAAYKAMMSVPVEYLEAKPQRAVLLSEFVGAAVPVNTSQRVLDILERNGIRRVEFYAKPEERGAAITRIAKGQDVLFEDNGPHLPQGVTVFGPESTQAVVHFFEAKDLSTSPHEIWHIFRRVLENMATREGASLKVRQDWALACDFVGAQVGETWTREQEEKWADAGLTYLMEGKAPSANLRGVFGRMKDWLLSLYRTFRNMVGINPEMRGVFDRLLATEDELKAAQADLHAVPLFTEGRAFDYDEATRELRQATEDEIMAYRVGKLAAMRKLWAQEGKAQADKMEHQVLIDALAREGGVRLDGEEVDTKTLQEIRKHRPGKLLVGPEGKLSLAEAADMVGKPTEQFLGWLASAKKKSALVREFVAEQEKAFGDDFDASEAMMSERLEKVLELESKYLAQAVNGATYVSPKALKSWVREKTGQTKADQALVGEFDALKVALRREATAAERAFRAGKAGEALAAKERQRAVLAELRARLADQKQAATIQARAVRMADAALKGDSKVDWEFGEQLVRLVVHFGLEGKRKSIFPRQPERMPSLLQFIQAKDADGWTQHSGLIPEWLFAEGQGQLGRSHHNHWKNLTVEQLRDVDKALRYLYDAGRKERQYLMDSREIELVTVADKLIHRMDGLKQVQALADYKREGMVGGMTDNMRRAMAEITNMEYLWDQVDGWESAGRKGTRSGPAWEFIRLPLFEARTAELKEFGRVSQELEEILQPLRGMKNRERFELAGVPLLQEVREEWGGLWNHERVLAAALNMGNAGNLGAMKAGFGWQDEHLDIIAKQLTADEWRMVQRLWDLIDSLRPLLDAAYYALHGQHMPLVEPKALQVETKDGQVLNLKGGYYPLIGDHRLNDKAGHFAEQDLMKNETMALFAPAKVKDSFTLKRTGMALPPRLSLSVLTRHVQQTVHYATHAVAIRNIQRIINLPEFTAQFKAKFGEHNYRMLTPWLKNIARPDNPEMGFWEGILEKWRTLGTISALGMNLQVAMLQLSSIPQSAQDIGWNWLLRGYSAMANPARTVEMVKLVRELSPLMRDRLQDMDRDVNRNLAKYGPTNRKLQFQVGDQHVEVGMEEFQRWVVFGPISFSDACVAYPTWLGAFMKFQSQGKDEKTAARMADDVVLRAQSSGNPMSLSALQHGAGWRRLITMFASFTINYQNRLRHYVRGLREGKVSGVDYARHLFNETLLPVVLTSIMLKLLKDNELPEPKDLAWDSFGYLLSGFPIARGIPRMLEFGYGGVMDSPAFKGVDLTAKAGKDLIKAFTDGGNANEHLLSFIKDATDLAGFATGVPTLPVYRFAKGVHDLASGEETNPFRPFFSPSPDKAKH